MKKLLFLASVLLATTCYASDYHQNDQSHRVIYTILDATGTPVTGQTVSMAVERSQDNKFLDFNDNTFKSSGWTTRLATMYYDTTGEYYYRVISIDNGGIVSGDYAVTVSNDNATYKDHQTEVVGFDSLGKLVKINR